MTNFPISGPRTNLYTDNNTNIVRTSTNNNITQVNNSNISSGNNVLTPNASPSGLPSTTTINSDLNEIQNIDTRSPDVIARASEGTTIVNESLSQQAGRQIYDAGLETSQYTPIPLNQSVGNLDNQQNRDNIIGRVTQLDANNSTSSDGDRCGAAAITSAAIYAGGTRGFETVINLAENGLRTRVSEYTARIQNLEANNTSANDPRMVRARERLSMYNQNLQNLSVAREHINSFRSDNNNTAINFGDIANVQDALYHSLGGFDGVNGEMGTGLPHRVVNDFMQNSPELRNILSERNVQVRSVDMVNPNGEPTDHFIFTENDSQGNATKVYDPWPQVNGQQLMTGPEVSTRYSRAETGTY